MNALHLREPAHAKKRPAWPIDDRAAFINARLKSQVHGKLDLSRRLAQR